jgi:hypothetical protein
MNNGRTHWDGCWADPKHHECAIGLINLLKSENRHYRKALSLISRECAQEGRDGEPWDTFNRIVEDALREAHFNRFGND